MFFVLDELEIRTWQNHFEVNGNITEQSKNFELPNSIYRTLNWLYEKSAFSWFIRPFHKGHEDHYS
jgi:hypothetical protein